MELNKRAALLIRMLMGELRITDKIVFPGDKHPPSFTSGAVLEELDQDPMKVLLRRMLTGWCLQEASYEHVTESTMRATRSPEDSMAEACGGDERLGRLLVLFGHWSNDVVSEAAHYGLTIARRQPDGTLLHSDGTVDTLMRGGVLEVVDIEPAPSPGHYWHKGQWNASEEVAP